MYAYACICGCLQPCLCICAYMHMCVRVCTCMSASCMRVGTNTDVLHTKFFVCIYAHIRTCVHVCTRPYMCVYLCRCVRETDRIRWQTGVTGQASSRRGRTSLQSGHRACLVRRPPACQCVVLLTNTHRHTHTRTYTVVSLFCVFLTVWDIEKHRDRE